MSAVREQLRRPPEIVTGGFTEPAEALDLPLRPPAAVRRWAPRLWAGVCAAVVVLVGWQAGGLLRHGVLPAVAPTSSARAALPGQQQLIWDGLLGERPVEAAGGYPRVLVPRLRIELPVGLGDGGPAPVAARAWLLPGTAPVDSGRGSFIYGPDRPGAFALLDLVRVGELVEIVPAPGAAPLRFAVAAAGYLVPSDRSEVAPGPGVLVLETPAGYLDGSPRFYVEAHLIKTTGG